MSKNPAISETVANLIKITGKTHPLAEFGVIYEQKVAWGDMDAFQHVNNVRYYDYAQSARVHYLEQVELFDENSFTVIASSSCQYLKAVTFPDTLHIGIRAKKIGNTSLINEYVYYSTAQNAVVATAETVLVFMDTTGTSKRAITDNEREKLLALDQATVKF